ncbi:MAG: thioredoxin domain-containing protein [Armatimonadetes bacterium]|nr:thioredoxin domain-containing protein [Armatimonadota bacterium]
MKVKGRNHLSHEKSPYLLQHAENPVDWYPWGEAAFEKARREDKPIFLSIGYSTCHWCHVMERESFENPEVARLLNEVFVCVKVDREERPDLDNIYMAVCQKLTGSGGWPLTILMTPEKKPFFAATYLPKTARFGQPGMVELIPRVKQAWAKQRKDILDSAGQISHTLAAEKEDSSGKRLEEPVLKSAFEELAGNYDSREGGFGSAPKFPTPHNLLFLLRYWKRSGNPKALEMVLGTLSAMRRGGIYDHVGFGFHRYSTDTHWLVPHFEKMLYDQALLSLAYTEAYQATRQPDYAHTAREILTYALRDMTSKEGGFYSAEDADSEGEEGKFYLWAEQQIREVLGEKEAGFALKVFSVQRKGNFTDEVHGKSKGANLLHFSRPIRQIAGDLGISEEKLQREIEKVRLKLFAAREKRIHPGKDDKVLTDWNGLMIAALARAGRVFDEPRYAEAAKRAADFLLRNLRDPSGRLLHRYRDGEAALPAHVDDYAFLTWGLLELYQTTFETRYLQAALDLNDMLMEHYWDKERGGFFLTAEDSEKLLFRPKESYDGATPSGNSVAMLNLLHLARLTADPQLEEKAAALSRAFAGSVRRTPSAHTHFLCAVDFGLGPSSEVVIAGAPGAEDTRAMLKALNQTFLPNKVVLLRPQEGADPALFRLAEFTKNQTAIGGKATAYVCRNHQCNRPTTDPKTMREQLRAQPW